MIQDILTVKIERNIYVNEEKAVSEIQILINKTFLLFSHHELLMSFINKYTYVCVWSKQNRFIEKLSPDRFVVLLLLLF